MHVAVNNKEQQHIVNTHGRPYRGREEAGRQGEDSEEEGKRKIRKKER